jgi:hypothetical protein
MGGHYPWGGINLGPARTFGYIGGRREAAEARQRSEGPCDERTENARA